MSFVNVALIVSAVAATAAPQSDLEQGFAGALRGCEEWVLNPASWSAGTAPFVAKVGLGSKMGAVSQVDEVSLPPPPLRLGNHFWRINSTASAGYVLVVSDEIPMCHITGGGDVDLQPAIESVVASSGFGSRWERLSEKAAGEMKSTTFRNRTDRRLSMVISRANRPGGRLDHVQVLATAIYEMPK